MPIRETSLLCLPVAQEKAQDNWLSAHHGREAAHGKDERAVEPMKLRRSLGAEVNWGIRFTCEADADMFLKGLAGMQATLLPS